VHLPAESLGQQQARVAQQQRRPAREIFRQLPRPGEQLVGRQHLGDQTQLELADCVPLTAAFVLSDSLGLSPEAVAAPKTDGAL
jgi:hypothetical protein